MQSRNETDPPLKCESRPTLGGLMRCNKIEYKSWGLMSFIRNFSRICTYVKHHIFIKCPRLASFDHGLAISSRSIVSVRSRSHASVKSSPRRSWFITERITVFTNFSFEKLRSADADVTGTVMQARN